MKLLHMIAFVLAMVGALNWGLVGLGWLVGNQDWNVVHMLLGQWMQFEAIVYILVGLSAVMLLITHKKDCRYCGTSAPMTTGM
jgi:uncharacterized membrane protein YuzA (DUF378 family)